MIVSSTLINIRTLITFILIACPFFVIPSNAQVQVNDFEAFKFQVEENVSALKKTEIKQEIRTLIELQKGITEEDIRAMNYWNASYPSYRWHQVMMKISKSHKGHKNGGRVAILHLAIYDALAAVWKHKKQHQMKAPC